MEKVEEFYNRQWRASDEDVFAHAFEEAIAHSYFLLGDLKGKKLLELGCGSGMQALYFAENGADVTVIDLSPESVRAVEKLAAKHDASQKLALRARLMNAESLEFPPAAFDAVYINSVMMHVDQQKVLRECARVLKPSGKLAIVEPLQYAPFVQLYRLFSSYKKMNPHYATLRMFREGKKHFSGFTHKEFYLFSSALLPLLYFRSSPLASVSAAVYRSAARLDSFLLRALPILRRLCWVSVTGYEK